MGGRGGSSGMKGGKGTDISYGSNVTANGVTKGQKENMLGVKYSKQETLARSITGSDLYGSSVSVKASNESNAVREVNKQLASSEGRGFKITSKKEKYGLGKTYTLSETFGGRKTNEMIEVQVSKNSNGTYTIKKKKQSLWYGQD